MNVLGDILNAGEIVEYQEYYGFTGSFFKIYLIVIDKITKKMDEYEEKPNVESL